MFGRQVTLKLKGNNSATELNRIAETEILPILRKQKGFRGGLEDSCECDRWNADGKDLRVRQFNVPPGCCFQVDVKQELFSPSGGAAMSALAAKPRFSYQFQSLNEHQ
jgi:hypothetical protein